jgi:hypothetical protein
VTFGGPLTNANIASHIFDYISPHIRRIFTFLNTTLEIQINATLLDQIKSITVDDTVSNTGPQIFIGPNIIPNGTELLAFLTTDAEYGNINNNIEVTQPLINTGENKKILVNITPNSISIIKS